MRLQNLSWAGGAGAINSNPRDLARWVRALFGGRVTPQRQLDEMKRLVSQKTGDAVDQATEQEPAFGLDIAQVRRTKRISVGCSGSIKARHLAIAAFSRIGRSTTWC
jgi:CubicO group peptidase (beta-lactamase class C family)